MYVNEIFEVPTHILKTKFKYKEYLGYIYDENNMLYIIWTTFPKYDNLAELEQEIKEEYRKLKLF